MIFTLGLIFLFFLPVIESFDHNIAFNLLITGSLLVNFSTFRRKKIVFDSIELVMILMLIIFSLSTTLSWSISRSFAELLRYFAYFLIFVSIRRFQDPILLLKRFFIPMVIVNTIILSIISIVYFLPIFHLSPPTEGMNLFYPVFGHNHLSDILLFTLPIMISLTFYKSNKFNKSLLIIENIIMVITFIFTMSRGAMLALVFAFMFCSLFINRDRRWHPWILTLSIITIFFLLVSFIFSNFIVSPQQGKLYPKFLYKSVLSEDRLNYFQQSSDNFKSHPIFGTGLDTFRYVSRMKATQDSGWSWYVHNQFLQIFTETGFLGGLLFSVLIISLLIYAFSNIKYYRHSGISRLDRGYSTLSGLDAVNPIESETSSGQQPTTNNQLLTAILIALFASTIHSFIDFDWQFISIFLIFWMVIGLLLPKKETDNKGNNYLCLFFVLAVLILYLSQFIIPFNIEKLLAKDEKESVLQAYRLDNKNVEIVKKLAQLEIKEQNFDQAHYWNLKAIFLVPKEASNLIKQDALLYFVQIKKAVADKNIKLTLKYLETFSQSYPLFFQISGGDYYLVNLSKMNNSKDKFKALNLLKEYSNIAQRKIFGYKQNPFEIQIIIENLKNLKTIY